MDSINQLSAFFVCALAGVIGGVFYEPFFVAEKLTKEKLNILFDALFFLFFSAASIFFSVKYSLGNIRGFMYAGNFTGLFLYMKSFHKMVAFFEKKCYTILKKIFAKKKLPKTITEK